MKGSVKISGIMLIIALSAGLTMSAQKGRGMKMDSVRMRSDTAWSMMTAPRHFAFRNDSAFMKNRNGNFRGTRPMPGMRGFGPGHGFSAMGPVGPGRNMMTPGFGRGMQFGRQQLPPMAFGPFSHAGQGRRMIGNIPDLSDKQKGELSAIMEKQRQDTQNLIKEHQEKMRQLREANRKKIMDLLNNDQKIWFEEHEPANRF